MSGVPLGRRNLFSERRRAFLGIAGVGVSLLMVLVLGGVFAGAMRQVTRYIDSSNADLIVSQRGVRTMHMSSSSIPLGSVDQIRLVDGVHWADPILYDSATLVASGKRALTYLIGFVSEGRGGPISLVSGREPGRGEIVLDERAAADLGVDVGEQVRILDRSWRISGLTSGMTNVVNTVSYVRFSDFATARGSGEIASYVLVGTDRPPDVMVRRIEAATGLTAQSRPDFSGQERQGVKDMTTDLMQIMTLAAFLIGLVVIGLTLYATTLSRLREIGVAKALGATRGRLGRIVLSQAGWTVGSGLAVAVGLALASAWVLGRTHAFIPIELEWGSVVRAAVGAALLGAFGAILPLIRVSRVDPATVFRR